MQGFGLSVRALGLVFWGEAVSGSRVARRLQYPLIKEHTLNYSRTLKMIHGMFLNQGILESLGASWPEQR